MSQFKKIRRHYITIESPWHFPWEHRKSGPSGPSCSPAALGLKRPVGYSLLFPLLLGTREEQSSLHFIAAADLLFPNSREIFLCTPVPIQSGKQTAKRAKYFGFLLLTCYPHFMTPWPLQAVDFMTPAGVGEKPWEQPFKAHRVRRNLSATKYCVSLNKSFHLSTNLFLCKMGIIMAITPVSYVSYKD